MHASTDSTAWEIQLPPERWDRDFGNLSRERKPNGWTYQAIEDGQTLHFEMHTGVFEVHIRGTLSDLMVLLLLLLLLLLMWMHIMPESERSHIKIV
jgi:hypothetical protein